MTGLGRVDRRHTPVIEAEQEQVEVVALRFRNQAAGHGVHSPQQSIETGLGVVAASRNWSLVQMNTSTSVPGTFFFEAFLTTW